MRLVIIALAIAASANAAFAAPAKPAPAAAKAATFDARDPKALVGLLNGMDAKAGVASSGKGMVVLDIATPGGKFGAQFVQCDETGKACGAVAFSTAFERRGPNLQQINDFNRTQVACRGYLTDDGRSNVMYAAMLTSRLSAAEMKQHLGIWQGCLATFGRFNRDPAAYFQGS
ncbi:MAG: hypothetical protein V4514_15345 [Pseudomonadota bacterium]|uniref:hypothetical protein n=1 Tax=Phenylobacterium sp. TaxID=1871053 RepID=UPI0025D315EF|nr:hypothetical protein [Phenylobacterium sp.]MBT9471205.1 hypothetical protein [Phenylobacterium sp.]